MSKISTTSRQMAEGMKTGTHRLSNQMLREAYGLSRVTTKARTDIAHELRRAGLEILSDPSAEPLVVRKAAPQRVRSASPRAPKPPWWKRRWVIAVGGILAVALIAGALDDSGKGPSTAPAARADTPAQETPPSATTATRPEPAPTFADAEQAVEDDDFPQALLIAAALGNSEKNRIRRKISRTLARQARSALRAGDRAAAGRAIRRADRFGATPEIRAARSSYRAAKSRASARAAARRAAERAAAAEKKARAAERAAAERAAEESYETESYDAPSSDMSGPSSVNWCGKRDGDGDGIYCEGE